MKGAQHGFVWWALAALGASGAAAQNCTLLQPASGINPTTAPGYSWQLVANGLTSPRTITFDASGNLWVLEAGKGVSKHLVVLDSTGCPTVAAGIPVISDTSLTHGMLLQSNVLVVSSAATAYGVRLDPTLTTVIPSSQRTLVTGMASADHVTRTLLLAAGTTNQLIISRGSSANLDPTASTPSGGHSEIKMFNITNALISPRDFTKNGLLLGWGLRNDVGMAQHPVTSGLFAVENSADNIQRDGVDIHLDNPAEELNYLGVPSAIRPIPAKNFGYPNCYTTWNASSLPNSAKLTVGTPFALNSSADAQCLQTQAPRLALRSHMAPIDIKFTSPTRAYVSFHGSWDTSPPVGYAVGYIDFNSNGQPVQPANSNTAVNMVFQNTDNTVCPGACFRPTGMAIDKSGRLWVASDATGEIYLLTPPSS